WTDVQEGGTGSGIIYKQENDKAYIVTNNHVIEDAQEIEIELANEEVVEAKLLGADSLTDLAVLEIDDEHIEAVAEFSDSDELEVGETVVAIGNPLGSEFAGSVTKGIISGLKRSVEVDTTCDKQADWVTEVLQTDAAINPGNSGGALVDTNGKVIGINSMKVAQQAVEGIGLAIPSNTAQPIMKDLEEKGEVKRPTLGIATAPLNRVPPEVQQEIELPKDVRTGMVIANVDSDYPSETANTSNKYKPIIKELKEKDEIKRPTLDIATATLNRVPPEVQQEIELPKDVRTGMVIANVDSDSPSENAGLEKFDVITKIDDQEITSIADIKVALYTDSEPSEKVTVEFIRNGQKESKELTLTN